MQRVNNIREVRAFQERFGPVPPHLYRDGCCTTYAYYLVNGTLVSYTPYDTSRQYPSVRNLQLAIAVDPLGIKTSMTCSGAGMYPMPLQVDIQTIRTTDCLVKQ